MVFLFSSRLLPKWILLIIAHSSFSSSTFSLPTSFPVLISSKIAEDTPTSIGRGGIGVLLSKTTIHRLSYEPYYATNGFREGKSKEKAIEGLAKKTFKYKMYASARNRKIHQQINAAGMVYNFSGHFSLASFPPKKNN